MNKNLTAFSTFRDHLKGQKRYSNGDESFLGRLFYSFRGQSCQEDLNVTLRLTTIEYGQISIEDGETLNSNIVHMDFNPNYQDYSYCEEGFLIIKGDSGKIGKYEVKITQK